MRPVLKWILIVLGALLLLVVIAAPLLLGFAVRERMPMMFGARGMHGFGMLWLLGGWGLMLGRLFIPLLLIGLVLWAAYSLGRNASRPRVTQVVSSAQPIQGTVVPPAAVIQPAAVVQPAPADTVEATPEVIHTCGNCGRQVQPDWVACPYCGEKL